MSKCASECLQYSGKFDQYIYFPARDASAFERRNKERKGECNSGVKLLEKNLSKCAGTLCNEGEMGRQVSAQVHVTLGGIGDVLASIV